MAKDWLKFLGKFYKEKKSVDGGYTYKQAMVDAAKEYSSGGSAEPNVGATSMIPAKVGGNAEKLSALAPAKVSGGKNDLAGEVPLYPGKVSGGNAEKLSALAPAKVSGGKSKKSKNSKKNKSKKNKSKRRRN